MLQSFLKLVRRVRSFSQSRATSISSSPHPFDLATGLDTGGFIDASLLKSGHPHDAHAVSYYATAPSLVESMLDRWMQTPGRLPVENYTFIDFGSGKGRVVMIASKLPFRKCIGIELNPALHAIAAKNFQHWQNTGSAVSPLESVCQDAAEFEFPATPCLVYLFNPFTREVVEKLLHRIVDAFADRPGELDLLYLNAECRDLIGQHPGFESLWTMPITMSPEDTAADLLHQHDAEGNRAYRAELQEPCAAWRFVGNANSR